VAVSQPYIRLLHQSIACQLAAGHQYHRPVMKIIGGYAKLRFRFNFGQINRDFDLNLKNRYCTRKYDRILINGATISVLQNKLHTDDFRTSNALHESVHV